MSTRRASSNGQTVRIRNIYKYSQHTYFSLLVSCLAKFSFALFVLRESSLHFAIFCVLLVDFVFVFCYVFFLVFVFVFLPLAFYILRAIR